MYYNQRKMLYFTAPNHILKGRIMQAKSIIIGNTYTIKLGKNEVQGEVIEATENGWNVRLLASDKIVKVNNSERFIRKVQTIALTGDAPVEPVEEDVDREYSNVEVEENPKKVKIKQPKEKGGLSALDAAYRVLLETGTPLTVKQIAEVILEKGYCPNLKGATPHLTISSALQREIKNKGLESRFYKSDKGLFGAVENE